MKSCRTCGTEQPLMDYYIYTNGSLDRDCKSCRRAKVRANRLANIDHYREFDRARENLPHRVSARKAYQKTEAGKAKMARGRVAYYNRYPSKRKATIAVGNAVRDGRLQKQPCEKCGDPVAEAHHEDYSNPLDVRWLCRAHHVEWHRHNKPKYPESNVA